MKLIFLGTAAAEGVPALFCNCKTCEKTRKLKGKNIRKWSSILINDNLIIDARLGFYAVPQSFKIYLKVDLKEAATRAYNDSLRKDTEKYESIEMAMKDIKYRYEQENMRYLKTYNVRRDDMSNYDLVIDTTNKLPEEVANIILKEYKNWLKDKE